jgi:hypothetical protein
VRAVLCCGLGLFACTLAIQILIWRSFAVKNQPARLSFIFLVLPAFLIGMCLAVSLPGADFLPRMSRPAWCLVYLLDLSLSLSYMFLYTSVAGFGPSIAILEHVEESMPQGLPREELVPQWFSDENLAGARHENLVNSGLVSNFGGDIELQFRGWFIAQCFLIFRRFLGLPDLAKG